MSRFRLFGAALALASAVSAGSSAAHVLPAAANPTYTPRLVKDLDPTNVSQSSTGARGPFAVTGDTVYFTGVTEGSGAELWKKTGSAKPAQIVDLPGTELVSTVAFNGAVYTVRDGDAGVINELWKSDGTLAGTQRFRADLAVGSLYAASNTLYLNATGALWKSDGTESGTTQVTALSGGVLRWVGESGANTFFMMQTSSGNRLWRTDGTAAGTAAIADVSVALPDQGAQGVTTPPTLSGGRVYFIGSNATFQRALYRTTASGTGAEVVYDQLTPLEFAVGTTSVGVLADGPMFGPSQQFIVRVPLSGGSTSPVRTCLREPPSIEVCNGLGAIGDTLLFFSRVNDGVRTLYASAGTPEATTKLKDFSGGLSTPPFQSFGGALYFVTADPSGSSLIWRTDGTAAGTTVLKPGLSGGSFQVIGQRMFFIGENASSGRQAWQTDGSSAGTVQLTELDARGGDPASFVQAGGKLFFQPAGLYGASRGLWVSDGSTSGTVQLTDQDPRFANIQSVAAVGSRVFFFAGDDPFNTVRALWVTDGTVSGTRSIACPAVGCNSATYTFGGTSKLFYYTNDEFWATDGSGTGVRLWQYDSSAGDSFNGYAITDGDTFYFLTTRSLWRSDGTAAGTTKITTIPTEPGYSPERLTIAGARLFFTNYTAATGFELWTSDGTAAGTRIVEDFVSGPGNGTLGYQTVVGNRLYGERGGKLYRVNAAADGFELIRDFTDVTPTPFVSCVAVSSGTLFFTISGPGGSNARLWRSDGTTAGTIKLSDVELRPDCSLKADARGGVLFSGYTLTTGTEPWGSDGTSGGTRQIAEIAPGAASSSPQRFAVLGNRLLTSADDGSTGFELWALTPGSRLFLPLTRR